ncbi:hypothetical protein ABKV19_000294 [Rosa sericea]
MTGVSVIVPSPSGAKLLVVRNPESPPVNSKFGVQLKLRRNSISILFMAQYMLMAVTTSQIRFQRSW